MRGTGMGEQLPDKTLSLSLLDRRAPSISISFYPSSGISMVLQAPCRPRYRLGLCWPGTGEPCVPAAPPSAAYSPLWVSGARARL